MEQRQHYIVHKPRGVVNNERGGGESTHLELLHFCRLLTAERYFFDNLIHSIESSFISIDCVARFRVTRTFITVQ